MRPNVHDTIINCFDTCVSSFDTTAAFQKGAAYEFGQVTPCSLDHQKATRGHLDIIGNALTATGWSVHHEDQDEDGFPLFAVCRQQHVQEEGDTKPLSDGGWLSVVVGEAARYCVVNELITAKDEATSLVNSATNSCDDWFSEREQQNIVVEHRQDDKVSSARPYHTASNFLCKTPAGDILLRQILLSLLLRGVHRPEAMRRLSCMQGVDETASAVSEMVVDVVVHLAKKDTILRRTKVWSEHRHPTQNRTQPLSETKAAYMNVLEAMALLREYTSAHRLLSHCGPAAIPPFTSCPIQDVSIGSFRKDCHQQDETATFFDMRVERLKETHRCSSLTPLHLIGLHPPLPCGAIATTSANEVAAATKFLHLLSTSTSFESMYNVSGVVFNEKQQLRQFTLGGGKPTVSWSGLSPITIGLAVVDPKISVMYAQFVVDFLCPQLYNRTTHHAVSNMTHPVRLQAATGVFKLMNKFAFPITNRPAEQGLSTLYYRLSFSHSRATFGPAITAWLQSSSCGDLHGDQRNLIRTHKLCPGFSNNMGDRVDAIHLRKQPAHQRTHSLFAASDSDSFDDDHGPTPSVSYHCPIQDSFASTQQKILPLESSVKSGWFPRRPTSTEEATKPARPAFDCVSTDGSDSCFTDDFATPFEPEQPAKPFDAKVSAERDEVGSVSMSLFMGAVLYGGFPIPVTRTMLQQYDELGQYPFPCAMDAMVRVLATMRYNKQFMAHNQQETDERRVVQPALEKGINDHDWKAIHECKCNHSVDKVMPYDTHPVGKHMDCVEVIIDTHPSAGIKGTALINGTQGCHYDSTEQLQHLGRYANVVDYCKLRLLHAASMTLLNLHDWRITAAPPRDEDSSDSDSASTATCEMFDDLPTVNDKRTTITFTRRKDGPSKATQHHPLVGDVMRMIEESRYDPEWVASAAVAPYNLTKGLQLSNMSRAAKELMSEMAYGVREILPKEKKAKKQKADHEKCDMLGRYFSKVKSCHMCGAPGFVPPFHLGWSGANHPLDPTITPLPQFVSDEIALILEVAKLKETLALGFRLGTDAALLNMDIASLLASYLLSTPEVGSLIWDALTTSVPATCETDDPSSFRPFRFTVAVMDCNDDTIKRWGLPVVHVDPYTNRLRGAELPAPLTSTGGRGSCGDSIVATFPKTPAAELFSDKGPSAPPISGGRVSTRPLANRVPLFASCSSGSSSSDDLVESSLDPRPSDRPLQRRFRGGAVVCSSSSSDEDSSSYDDTSSSTDSDSF